MLPVRSWSDPPQIYMLFSHCVKHEKRKDVSFQKLPKEIQQYYLKQHNQPKREMVKRIDINNATINVLVEIILIENFQNYAYIPTITQFHVWSQENSIWKLSIRS